MSFARAGDAAGRISDPSARTEMSIPAESALQPRWWRPALPVTVVAVLLCLGLANVAALATWSEVEDGILWTTGPDGVVAEEVAPRSTAAAVGLAAGDLLVAIDDRPVQEVDDVA